jgi:hypothetical protein
MVAYIVANMGGNHGQKKKGILSVRSSRDSPREEDAR